MTSLLTSVILPVYNQADHIRVIVEKYEEALKRAELPHELILVVNGSRDKSLDVCQSLSEEYPPVRVIHSEKGGWGLAVKLGLKEARGDLLCYTNSARTSPQDLMLLVLYAVTFPRAVIKANRKIRENWRRRLGSLLYNLECRMLFDLSNWDINGTPKVFPRTFRKLLDLTKEDDLIDAEFSAICRREGYRMLEVPIFSARRHGGKSTTHYLSALKMYLGAYRLWRSMREKGV
ncbi:MAG TPA: glycosyltransferase family 2 protein [Chloroflexia bacterium]|nr:glycosyltransferase family 2 protein [Chloroflexia bacterium]